VASANIRSEQLALTDLVSGLNEWRNIQEIVRTTFKAMNDVIKLHSEAIARLEQEKATRTELQQVDARKADIAEVNAGLDEFNRVLETKAVAIDVAAHLERKASKQDVQELGAELSKSLSELQRTIDANKVSALESVGLLRGTLERKADVVELRELSATIDKLATDVQQKANAAAISIELDKKVC